MTGKQAEHPARRLLEQWYYGLEHRFGMPELGRLWQSGRQVDESVSLHGIRTGERQACHIDQAHALGEM